MEFQVLLSLCCFSLLLFLPRLSHGGWFNSINKCHPCPQFFTLFCSALLWLDKVMSFDYGFSNFRSNRRSLLRLKTENVTPVRLDPIRVTQLSWQPRAFLYKEFLTHEECDHLIKLAKDKLEKSMVVDDETGEDIETEIRTSSGMFLRKAQDDIVARIEERIATWTFLPPENGEDLQILRYELGQKYEPHFDYFVDKVNQQIGGHRSATVLMYLSDVKKGGETIFPRAEGRKLQLKDNSWSNCAKKGYAVKPSKGDALLFFSLHLNGTTDETSLHGSCPVIEGEKWAATKWIHVRSYGRSMTEDMDCTDEDVDCARWAREGECQKNPLYMVGDEETKGRCRKSCNVC
ncbi:hypothetical protein Cgig2_003652 [Carnegiea gigantea]|uniref:procollagen-proline 4-dioxygenase n=1 Tax=Carnegiea gigantea TaxID=171969 RepID=A0A9Q1JJH3_9CARY|nr:hypothetical protein Cgig2_003652 [Carnegiea gigantea]